jgi:hypothetical protein
VEGFFPFVAQSYLRGAVIMKSKLVVPGASLAVVGLLMGASVPARADTLLNLIDPSGQTNTAYALAFTALGSSTTISIGGYQVPSHEFATNNGIFLGGTGPNLLGGTWVLTPAALGSDTTTFNDGTSVPALNFGGVNTRFYDTYSQTIATTPGGSYFLDFLYSNNISRNAPSGFLVTTSGRAAATPLPPAWSMMLIGLAGLGFITYRGAKKDRVTFAAA